MPTRGLPCQVASADPSKDRLHPVSGCPLPPVPSAEDVEFEAALAEFHAACDEIDQLRSDAQLWLF